MRFGGERQGAGRILRGVAAAGAMWLASGAAAWAGTAHGTVINRTTGKPAANVELVLVDLQAGMAEVATGKSDAQGQWSFTNDALGRGPMLVRATYEGVTFNTALRPGKDTADIDVFEVSKDGKLLTVLSHVMIFQPHNEKLIGVEEYIVQNASNPPMAYFKTEGNFEFPTPEKATLQNVATVSSTGMSVNQAPIEKGKGLTSIAYAFRPGQTSIRISYEMPYAGNTATLKVPALYPGMKMLVVAPPGVTVTGDGLSPAGQEQGMMLYGHEPLAAKGVLSFSLSGQGEPIQADAGGQGQGQGEMPQEGNSRTQADLQAIPGRLDGLKWYILAGFAALFAIGGLLLSKKQVVVTPVEGESVAAAMEAPIAVAAATTSSKSAAAVAAVNAQVSSSLDALKDEIFRLELRKQAGTISDEDYAQERAKVEKRLRDLVQG